jgi:hypothetical protein
MRSLWLVCGALLLLARPGAAAEASVETAYKREFAFLEAERPRSSSASWRSKGTLRRRPPRLRRRWMPCRAA